MTVTDIDPFDAPEVVTAGSGGMDNPTVKQLATGCSTLVTRKWEGMGEEHTCKTKGRLVIFWVREEGSETVDTPKGPKQKPRLTVDFAFLDGEPIDAKLDKDGEVKVQYDEALVAPSRVLTGSWISNAILVRQLRPALKTGRPRLGRLARIPAFAPTQDKRYVLLDPTPEETKLGIEYLKKMPVLDVSDDTDPLAEADEDTED